MTDGNNEVLPPLGERTPARGRSDGGSAWYKRPWVVGLAGIVLGLLLGLGLAAATDSDDERAAVEVDERADTTVPVRRTTTTVRTLPPECADAIRTAEQSLTLLDQAFQTARRFDVGELDRMLSELQEVRRSLTDRVRACVERS